LAETDIGKPITNARTAMNAGICIFMFQLS
jgi:hypothetical protein